MAALLGTAILDGGLCFSGQQDGPLWYADCFELKAILAKAQEKLLPLTPNCLQEFELEALPKKYYQS